MSLDKTARGLVAIGVALLFTSAARADDVAAFGKDREMRFAAFKSAHKPQDAEIARIKAASAALVAAAPPPAATDAPPVIWRVDATSAVVFDIPVGPRMVVVPAGEATIGAAAGPRRRVRFAAPVAIGMFPITYGEYGWFAAKTARPAAPCAAPEGTVAATAPRDWQSPGFAQTARSPVTCVTFDDANAYVAWLSAQTGQRYRLLTEDEYEFVNRAGTTTAFWWGDDAALACQFVNALDADAASIRPSATANTCHDGHVFTMPLDASKANPFGLFDTTGNVSSWTNGCWRRLIGTAPNARSCGDHVVRGGSWASTTAELRTDARAEAMGARSDIGFRTARNL